MHNTFIRGNEYDSVTLCNHPRCNVISYVEIRLPYYLRTVARSTDTDDPAVHCFGQHQASVLREPHRFPDGCPAEVGMPQEFPGIDVKTGHLSVWRHHEQAVADSHRYACCG